MKFNVLLLLIPLFLFSCSGTSKVDGIRTYKTRDTIFTNKVIPQAIRAAAVEALSHYPELSETEIEFKFEDEIVNSFMQAQPKISTLFRSKKKRGYIIKITREMEIDSVAIPVEEIPYEVLLGWLGHELGHISDYSKKNGANMVWFGFTYLCFDKSKVKAERRADIEALKHGMADEIIATKNFILANTSLPEVYKDKIRKYYISPEQVLELVKEMEEEHNDDKAELTKAQDSLLPVH
tara:strand:+ start:55 stop:765 length:711 start_codon:yes stop_codon:yes gene_type:complete